MPIDIKKLLRKKRPTGEEVGKALIASLLNDIKNQAQGREYKILFTQEDLKRMVDSFQTEADYTAYGVYRDLYYIILDRSNYKNYNHHKFYNGYYRYLTFLHKAFQAETVLADADRFPLIMTEKQYRKAQQDALEANKATEIDYYTLFFDLLYTYLTALEKETAEAIPEKIKDEIEALKAEPATGHALLSRYNELTGEGYYTLPDGTRSDNITLEEWREALSDEFFRTHTLTIDGKKASKIETYDFFQKEVQQAIHALFFNGIEAINAELAEIGEAPFPAEQEQEVLDALERHYGTAEIENLYQPRDNLYLEKLSKILDPLNHTEWHTYPEPPADLTAFDLLQPTIDVASDDDTNRKALLKTFKTEYAGLYKALDAYIKDAIPEAKSLTPSRLYKPFTTWGELAELNVGDFPDRITPTGYDIAQLQKGKRLNYGERSRIYLSGIAILQNPSNYQLDEDGNYTQLTGSRGFKELDSIDNIVKNGGIDTTRALRDNLVLPALSRINAFNAYMDIIGDVYGIEDIDIAKLDTAEYESRLETFNRLLYSLYFDAYGDKEERDRKRKLIKEIFSPLFIEAVYADESAVKEVKDSYLALGFSDEARHALRSYDNTIKSLEPREGAN